MAWLYEESITIDETKCGTADSTDFPMLFAGTYDGIGGKPDLRTVANGGKVISTSGYDIAFFSDAALTTMLKFERVGWSATTGVCEFWVKIPTLDVDANTIIYIAYGNAAIITDQQDRSNTWNVNYKGVYHLEDLTTSTVDDSTGNGHDGTKDSADNPIVGAAKIGNGQTFTSDVINFGVTDFDLTNNFTIECWVKSTSNGVYQGIFSKAHDATGGYNGYSLAKESDNYFKFVIFNANAPGYHYIAANSANTDSDWHHLVGIRDSGTSKLYLDGAIQTASSAEAPGLTSNSLIMGKYYQEVASYYLVGSVDEGRISNTPRTASYVTASYNNQNSPSTFYTLAEVNLGFLPRMNLLRVG